jgi:hypothetical protein
MAKYFDMNSFLAEQEAVPVVFNSGCTGLGKEMDKQNDGHDVSHRGHTRTFVRLPSRLLSFSPRRTSRGTHPDLDVRRHVHLEERARTSEP